MELGATAERSAAVRGSHSATDAKSDPAMMKMRRVSFVLFDSLCLINNLSVIKGRVFLG